MASKYYAVKKGRTPGIYRSWDECKAQTDGYSGAVYKSFKTEEEAQIYMGNEKSAPDCYHTHMKEQDGLVAYVDGSYYKGEFSYGMVIIDGDKEKYFGEMIDDKELAQMHNVAGEIKGSEAAMKYAIENGYDSITIYHDYEGIARWCLGEWKTNKEGTKAYKAFYDSIKDRLKVKFIKVKGHSNDKYNDMADALAKKALGIE